MFNFLKKKKEKVNLLIITGSHRQDSESKRIANMLKDRSASVFNEILEHDLATLELPFWDEGVWKNDKNWKEILTPLFSDIKKSDAFIFVVPEWGGMVPAKVKNYLLFGGYEQFGHKPALIVGVSSGMGGAYPINELRTSGYKNTKINFIPEHLIFRNVKELFINNTELDKELYKRTDFSLKVLSEYAKALAPIRKMSLGFGKYPYGM